MRLIVTAQWNDGLGEWEKKSDQRLLLRQLNNAKNNMSFRWSEATEKSFFKNLAQWARFLQSENVGLLEMTDKINGTI